jgi:hypothetical protein
VRTGRRAGVSHWQSAQRRARRVPTGRPCCTTSCGSREACGEAAAFVFLAGTGPTVQLPSSSVCSEGGRLGSGSRENRRSPIQRIRRTLHRLDRESRPLFEFIGHRPILISEQLAGHHAYRRTPPVRRLAKFKSHQLKRRGNSGVTAPTPSHASIRDLRLASRLEPRSRLASIRGCRERDAIMRCEQISVLR